MGSPREGARLVWRVFVTLLLIASAPCISQGSLFGDISHEHETQGHLSGILSNIPLRGEMPDVVLETSDPIPYTDDTGRKFVISVRLSTLPERTVTLSVTTTSAAAYVTPDFRLVTTTEPYTFTVTGTRNEWHDEREFLPYDLRVSRFTSTTSPELIPSFGDVFAYHLDTQADSSRLGVSTLWRRLLQGGQSSGLLIRCPQVTHNTPVSLTTDYPGALHITPSSITCTPVATHQERVHTVTLTAPANGLPGVTSLDATVLVSIHSGPSDSSHRVPVTIYSGTEPGLYMFSPAREASNGAAEALVRFGLTSPPTQPVFGSLRTSSPAWTSFASSTEFLVTPEKWAALCSAVINGQQPVGYIPSGGASTSLLPFEVTIDLYSEDPRYNGTSESISLNTKLVPLPRIDSAEPSVSSFQGGQTILVRGENIDEQASIYVDTVWVSNRTVTKSTEDPTVSEVSFVTPPITVPGYSVIAIHNPDSGQGRADILYYTDVCPSPGVYAPSEGSSVCHPCPVGGECPGGSRVWPLPGYWTESEDSMVVLKCSSAAHCLGGRGSPCAPQYTGFACSRCSTGNYHHFQGCRSCSADGPRNTLAAILIITLSICCILMWLMCVIASDRVLSHLWVCVIFVQLFHFAAKYSPRNTSIYYLQVNSYISIFALDMAFLRPACWSTESWSNEYLMKIAFVFMLIIPIETLLLILYKLRPSIVKTSQGGEVALTLAEYYKYRLVRVAILFLAMSYMVIAHEALEAVNCAGSNDGELRIVAHRNVRCFKDDLHIPLYVLSILLLMLYVAGLPIMNFLLLRRNLNLLYKADILGAFGILYEMCKKEHALLTSMWPLPVAAICVSNAIGQGYPLLQMTVASLILVLICGFILYRRPFRESWLQWAIVLASCATVLVYVLNYLGHSDIEGATAVDVQPSLAVRILEIAALAFLGMLLLLVLFNLVLLEPREGQVEREPPAFVEKPMSGRNRLNIYKRRPAGLYVDTFTDNHERFTLRENRHLLKPRTPTSADVEEMQSEVDVDHHMEHGELDDMLDALDTVYDIHPARKALMLSTSAPGGKLKNRMKRVSGGTSDTDFVSSVASMEVTHDESSPDMVRLAASMGKALAHSAGPSARPSGGAAVTMLPPSGASTVALSGAGLRHRPVLLERFAKPSRALCGQPRGVLGESESSSSDLENLEAIVHASPIKKVQTNKGKAPLQNRTPTATSNASILGIAPDPVQRVKQPVLGRTNSTPLQLRRDPTSPSADGSVPGTTLSHGPSLGRVGESTPNIVGTKGYVQRRASVAGGASSVTAAASANASYLLSKDSASSFSDFDLQEVIDSTVHRLHALEQER